MDGHFISICKEVSRSMSPKNQYRWEMILIYAKWIPANILKIIFISSVIIIGFVSAPFLGAEFHVKYIKKIQYAFELYDDSWFYLLYIIYTAIWVDFIGRFTWRRDKKIADYNKRIELEKQLKSCQRELEVYQSTLERERIDARIRQIDSYNEIKQLKLQLKEKA